jgi:aromatic ring-opening dioxygenase catalytic subunit (LigB family)
VCKVNNEAFPTLFIPHGAGPCFFMEWEPVDTWDAMHAWLRSMPAIVGRQPKAILLVSAHWETQLPTINVTSAPGLLYDYSGFPPHTYDISWPAKGSPELVARAAQLLSLAGIEHAREMSRGLDHGVFIPLKVAFPEADIPVVQMSLQASLDPESHLAIGRALAPLRRESVLIIGSGMSYHNMHSLRRSAGLINPDSQIFDEWLVETVSLPQAEREARLKLWARAPGARASHPREEHLLPLHVVAGAAGDDAGRRVFRDEVLGSVQSAFQFGGQADSAVVI